MANALISRLLSKTFIKKPGDSWHEIAKGEMYWVVQNISQNPMYGKASKVASTVIKNKRITENQARVISQAINNS